MNSESMLFMEKTKFYNRLRLIFTYYSSQGSKEEPLFLREKNFKKFLNDSTISQLLKTKDKYLSLSLSSPQRKTNNRPKSSDFQVIINTFNKPMNYMKFEKVIAHMIYGLRFEKKQEQNSQNENIQNNLFEMCQQDDIINQIFSFLYEEIENETQFGNLILLSKNTEIFNQINFQISEQHYNILKKVYNHYFTAILEKDDSQDEDILAVLKKFCHQFQICPRKLSTTQVFVLLLSNSSKRSKSVYQLDFENKFTKNITQNSSEWQNFTFIHFVKQLILMAHFVSFKNKKEESFMDQTVMIRFFEEMQISKGFKALKSTYKINYSFLSSKHNKNIMLPISMPIKQNKQLKFQSHRVPQNKKALLISNGFIKLLELIFRNYVDFKSQELMSQKNFEHFCSEFKVVPHLVSRRQIGEIYMRVFFQRDYFYQSTMNNDQGGQQHRDIIFQQNKLEIYKLVGKPDFGLKFEEFQKILIYGSELNKICSKFTSNQRLIYWIQHLFNQDRTKVFIEKSRTREKYFVQKDVNIRSMFKRLNKNDPLESNFYHEHESMYRKLKNVLK